MNYQFTNSVEDMNLEQIHAFLVDSYWCRGIPFEVLKTAIENSLCFGLVKQNQQIAFGRFITDRATFAYLADVFVLEQFRGSGLAKRMLDEAMALPELQGLRRMMLVTTDAHSLYKKLGFTPLPAEQMRMLMQRWEPNVYAKK